MLHFKLVRTENTPLYCHGHLHAIADYDDDQPSAHTPQPAQCFSCDTLEPPVRPASDFIRGKTAVPAGLYDLRLTLSPKFGRQLPILVDVPGMTGIRIHRGNTPADTRGCILPGRYVGNGRIVDSTPREHDIVSLLSANPDADITIVNNFTMADAQPVPDDALPPIFSTWPLADLIARSIWDRLRLATRA